MINFVSILFSLNRLHVRSGLQNMNLWMHGGGYFTVKMPLALVDITAVATKLGPWMDALSYPRGVLQP